MLRKIMLSLLLVCTVGIFAQDLKFGHVNIQELAAGMPEMKEGKAKLDGISKQYEGELAKMYEELNKKYTDFVAAKDSLTDAIKARRTQELQELEQRFNNFRQSSTEEVQKQQGELERSVMEAIIKAVKEVGDENGYVYIMDKNNTLYISSTKSTDVMDLVKAKLATRVKTAAPASTSAPVKTQPVKPKR
ncbi:MAG: OmpH family outer membrane protein [Bacteroidales bacterium]|nr:OmpH family outer membrane protein [Bacteroidales bacterium]